MKLLKSNLLSALELPASITGKRMTLPILSSLLIEAKNNTFTVRGTSLDQSAMSSYECEGELEPICINTTSFLRTIEFGGDEIELSVAKGKLVVENGAKTHIPILPANEFPETFKESCKKIGVNCLDLASAIKAVKWACSKDETRFQLQHVRIQGSPTIITASATPFATIANIEVASISATFEFMLHSDFASNFIRCLLPTGAVFSLSEKHARIEYEHGAYECKLPESNQFVPIEKVLAQERIPIGIIDRNEWLRIFTYISASWPATNPEIGGRATIQFWSNTCRILAESDGFTFDQTITGEFEKCEAKMNTTELRDCLSAFPLDSKIKLSHSDVAFVMQHENLTVVRQAVGVVK